MANNRKSDDRGELIGAGIASAAMGLLIMLFVSGVIPSRGESAPWWVGMSAGAVFMLGGLALMLRWFAGGTTGDADLPKGAPVWLRGAYYLLGLIAIGGLAAIGTWVAFGPGERVFSMSIPFLADGPANRWIGRTVFGIGTLLTWLFFGVAAVSYWRKLKGNPASKT
jgi:hypothetical protein